MKKILIGTFILIFIGLCLEMPASALKDYLCSYMWDMHFCDYHSTIQYPYKWYRTFHFHSDGTIRSRNDGIIGSWVEYSNYFNFSFSWDGNGFQGSISFINNSTIMWGSGEKEPEGNVNVYMIRLYKL